MMLPPLPYQVVAYLSSRVSMLETCKEFTRLHGRTGAIDKQHSSAKILKRPTVPAHIPGSPNIMRKAWEDDIMPRSALVVRMGRALRAGIMAEEG